jgi:hypothetical protein
VRVYGDGEFAALVGGWCRVAFHGAVSWESGLFLSEGNCGEVVCIMTGFVADVIFTRQSEDCSKLVEL